MAYSKTKMSHGSKTKKKMGSGTTPKLQAAKGKSKPAMHMKNMKNKK